MFLHFLFYKGYCFTGNIASIVIKEIKLSQKRKQGITNTTAKLIVITALTCKLIVLSEKCNLGHFPLEVCSIFKEITFMELVKFIPYFLSNGC